ncbi:hypothetical protein [Winogradskyella ouciana]|uniref:Uncharacterized protein n=1 Tax=Winogradskyella ouciana TaxID=2608631 RepID=A0A7K1GFY2_9FLAO|nr:hypothetical protein [Winogradskyella ouciana]MTE28227.1 hypothetical protein [Winogradskyella ouciana]
MKRYIYLLFILFLLNCDNERIVQLPEIENAKITEVKDVSPAYIFYDETQPDSTLFNRKNLIGTTNWLVNVDKRLTLKQAIPHIQYLQDKRKKASMHKNEDAKNYFTCNDTSMGSLGFVEFTDVNYIIDINSLEFNEIFNSENKLALIHFISNDFVSVSDFYNDQQTEGDIMKIDSFLRSKSFNKKNDNKIQLVFYKDISFQQYIRLRYKLSQVLNDKSEISNVEIIY